MKALCITIAALMCCSSVQAQTIFGDHKGDHVEGGHAVQGQGQGQKQGQRQTALGGKAFGLGLGYSDADSRSRSSSKSNADADAYSRSYSGAKQRQDASSANSISITEEAAEIPVNSAYAPALTAGVNPCARSISGGGQGAGFGFSVGGVFTDDGCEDRAFITTLVGLGEREAAIRYACNVNEDMRQALGDKCAPSTPSTGAPTALDLGPLAADDRKAPSWQTRHDK